MNQDISLSIGDLLRFLARGLVWAALVGAALAFGAYRFSASQTRVYESQATVVAAETNPDYQRFGVSPVVAPPLDVTAYEVAARSDEVLGRALQSLGVDSPTNVQVARLRRDLSVQTVDTRTSSLIYVSIQNTSPQVAADQSNAVAAALVTWDKGRAGRSMNEIITTLQQQVQSLTEQIRSLQTSGNATQDQINGAITLRAQAQQNLSIAQALSASAIGRLEVLQSANVPRTAIAPKPKLVGAIAGVLGVLLTYGVLLLRAALDTRIRDVEDLAAIAGLPILAEFPRMAKGARRLPREAASYLRTSVLFSTADANPKVILVTSPRAGDGKSSVAISLAEGFARNDYRTLLVDADLRQPVIHQEYRISRVQNGSLVDFLGDPEGHHQVARVLVSPKQQLHVIPAFQVAPQASELLSRGFRACLERWSRDYDVIIVDSPPVLAVADALTLAPFCTGTLLVANIQHTDRRQIRTSLDYLGRVGVRLLGVAATMVADPGKALGGYGYGYGPVQEEETPSTTARSTGTRARVRPRSGRG